MKLCELYPPRLLEVYDYVEVSPLFYTFTTSSGIEMFAEARKAHHPDYGVMLVFSFGFTSPKNVGASTLYSPTKTNAHDTVETFSTIKSILKEIIQKKLGQFDTLEFDTSVPQLQSTYDVLAPKLGKLLPSEYKYVKRESHGTSVYLYTRLESVYNTNSDVVATSLPNKSKKFLSLK